MIVGIINSRVVVNIEIRQTVADGDAFQVDGRFGCDESCQCGHIDASITLSFNRKRANNEFYFFVSHPHIYACMRTRIHSINYACNEDIELRTRAQKIMNECVCDHKLFLDRAEIYSAKAKANDTCDVKFIFCEFRKLSEKVFDRFKISIGCISISSDVIPIIRI